MNRNRSRIAARRSVGLSLILVCILSVTALADGLRFSRAYSDNAVLQRNKPVTITGFADKGSEVTVRFAGQSKEAVADNAGVWSVVLDAMPANSKGAELVATAGGAKVTVKNVVVGDVILFARQTSIDVSLGRDKQGQAAAAKLPADAGFRVMRITTVPAVAPQADLAPNATSGWVDVDKKTALSMSAAAFYVGRDLAAEVDVPIGIVDLNMGPAFPIAWMSLDALAESTKVFGEPGGMVDNILNRMKRETAEFESGQAQKELDEKYQEAVEKAKRQGKPAPEKPAPLRHPRYNPLFPATGYNAVLHPLRGMTLKGILLQLGNDYPYGMYEDLVGAGESTKRGPLGLAYKETYQRRKWAIKLEPATTPRIPNQWRQVFGDPTLPVGWITPPGSDLITMGRHHCEMRELQRQTAEQTHGVNLILPGTQHVPFSAQPADEPLLAKRCMNWVLGAVYQRQDVTPTGPVFDRMDTDYANAHLFFKPGTAEGLSAAPGALDYFEVAGADGVFVPAQATIDGQTVRLKTDKINRIANVRYNWRERPNQGLTNAAGLPMVPFRTDEHEYPGVIDTIGEEELPAEFTTPVTEWKSEGAVIVNGGLDKRIAANVGRSLGTTGLRVGFFGPNLYVNFALKGSPADGKIKAGDLIYSVNGSNFGDEPLKDVADAITLAESEAGEGKITFGVHRDGRNFEVPLKLEVIGTYSSTSPYDCPKADRIVANAEAFLAERGGVMPGKHPAFQFADALLLLGAGTPEYQGLVRRYVYARMAGWDPAERIDPVNKQGITQPWAPSAEALLVGEYYLATGDRNVLPFLKYCCENLAATQLTYATQPTPWPSALKGQSGGWRHNLYGRQDYGTMPCVGIPATLGFMFAKDAGVEYDYSIYDRALKWFIHNGVKVGKVGYGFHAEPVTTPMPIDPDKLKNGMFFSNNGAISGAAVLFDLLGDASTANRCSFLSVYSYNNTHLGHGGNFWNNFWTPLGARVHGVKSFQVFMKGNRWYQELQRMYFHGRDQGNAGMGAGQFLALVAPRERLRILGAPPSVFAANPPEALRPALDAFHARDYPACEAKVDALITTGVLIGEDLRKARQLKAASALLRKSIAHDLAKVRDLIEAGKFYEASLDVPQLKGVVHPKNADLIAIVEALDAPDAKARLADDKKRYDAHLKSLAFNRLIPDPPSEDKGTWQLLTTQSNDANYPVGQVPEAQATKWRLKVVESLAQAPQGWTTNSFDDSDWTATTLPISWHLNHIALLRAPFEIKNPSEVKALRLRNWTFRQQNMVIYINGTAVAKISNASAESSLTIPLNEAAVKALKKGRNTIAATYKNNWRWGRYTRPIELDTSNSVYNSGVSLLLEMRSQ